MPWEVNLRKFPSLRPRAYAEEMQKLIARAAQPGSHFALHEEISIVSERSGVSVDSALSDLVKAGVICRFAVTKSGRGGVGM
jgi:hypothetical protein